jgi:hypothetical protein
MALTCFLNSICIDSCQLRARAKITSHFKHRRIPIGCVAKARNMPDIPAFLRLARRAPQFLKLRINCCANPKMLIEMCPQLSPNKFICHTRMKRSGAWWVKETGNEMLGIRCAIYNGTYDKIFNNYKKSQMSL